MNWNEIIISVATIVLTGLATWAVTTFTNWLNTKISGTKSEHYIWEALEIVEKCVKATYQTYVEAIKGTDMWTKEAQEYALNLALEQAKATLSEETTQYITEKYGDLDRYLIGLIESILYDLKK